MNEARDFGRPAIRRIAALIRRELPTLRLDRVLWEGALVPTSRRTVKKMTATSEMAAVESKPVEALYQAGMKLVAIGVGNLPNHLAKALEWLALARSARVSIEKFTHLWLSVMTLTAHGVDTEKVTQKPRIDLCVTAMRNISERSRKDLAGRLKNCYDIRNDLWHEGNDLRITPELLNDLEGDAFTLVDWEFAMLGTPIPG